MAFVPQIERAFSMQFHNAGAPGIRLRHPNYTIGQETADELSLDLVSKLEAAADAVWGVLEHEGVLEAAARLTHASLLDIVDAGSDSERGDAAKALAAWPKDESGEPDFSQAERPDFINAFGYSLRDEKPQAQRPARSRRQARVAR